jgi:hypothetical protein
MLQTGCDAMIEKYDGGAGHFTHYSSSSGVLSLILSTGDDAQDLHLSLHRPALLDLPKVWCPIRTRLREREDGSVELVDEAASIKVVGESVAYRLERAPSWRKDYLKSISGPVGHDRPQSNVGDLPQPYADLLAAWRNTVGMLAYLSSSHPMVVLRLCRHDSPMYLSLSGLKPERYTGPVRWDGGSPAVARLPSGRWLIADESAGLAVVCSAVSIGTAK